MILGIGRRILVKVLCNYSPIMISSHHTPCSSCRKHIPLYVVAKHKGGILFPFRIHKDV